MLEHVPRDVTLTVTVSPVKGLEPSFELAETFAAARATRSCRTSRRVSSVDRAHLAEIVARFTEMGVRDVFVVAGDAEEPAGAYEGAAPLLDATCTELGHPFEQIGITGYPETPPADRRRDDDRGDVREGAVRDLHRDARSASTRASPRAGSTTSGRAARGCRSTSGSRAPCRGRSSCACRRESGSASRCASCASTATS